MVSIVISGLLSFPSCYLENEVGKKGNRTKNGQNMSSGPILHDASHIKVIRTMVLHDMNS